MWWRLSVLGVATASIVAILIAPVLAVKVKLELPPGVETSATPTPHQMAMVVVGLDFLVVAFIIGIAFWVARLIVRRHLPSRRGAA